VVLALTKTGFYLMVVFRFFFKKRFIEEESVGYELYGE